MHVESLEVDFFGLPTGRFGLAVRLLVGSALAHGNSCGRELDGHLSKKSVNFHRLDLGSSLSTTAISSASIASVRATFHTSRVPKCGLLRG